MPKELSAAQDPSETSSDPMDAYAPQRWTPPLPVSEQTANTIAWALVLGSTLIGILLAWWQK